MKVKDGKSLAKQDCRVVDATGNCRIVLWDIDVGKLKIEQCYKLENFTVRAFQRVKYLSVSDNTIIKQIDKIGEITTQPACEEFPNASTIEGGGMLVLFKKER